MLGVHPTLLERLQQQRGYRLTAQRRVVAQVLEGENLHLTADEVLSQAEAMLPEISRATVYSTLQQFVDMGQLLELSLDGRSRRYDPNIDPPHHHLICTECDGVFDVAHNVAAPDAGDGLEIESAQIIYRGRCTDCA